MGDQVDKDMIAVRITPDVQMAVVAAPGYLSGRATVKRPEDLMAHNCINLRLPTHGALYAWEFEKGDQKTSVRVEGQTVFNNTFLMMQAALDGAGIAYIPRDLAAQHIATQALVPLLAEWCPNFPGYYLYYPGRQHLPAAFTLVVDALRWHRRE